jgi:hypothetical protein
LVNPNERQATLNGLIWGAALREMPFLPAATLFLVDVQQAHGTRNALQRAKMAISLRPELVLTGPNIPCRIKDRAITTAD